MSDDVERLTKLAYHNEKIPEKLELPEQLLFLSLRFMYRSFNYNQINKETAISEKNQIIQSYNYFKFMRDMFSQNIKMKNKFDYHILQMGKNDCELCKKAVAIFTNMDKA